MYDYLLFISQHTTQQSSHNSNCEGEFGPKQASWSLLYNLDYPAILLLYETVLVFAIQDGSNIVYAPPELIKGSIFKIY